MITGKFLIETIIEDFKSFFYIEQKIFLDYQKNYTLSVKSEEKGKKHKILVSTEMAEMKIENNKDLLFILILMGHELSHIINKHNTFIDRDTQDSRSIEMWADYFGISITLTIFILKTKTSELVFKRHSNNYDTISEVLKSLDTVYYKVYSNKNHKYESPEFRSITAVTGIISWIAKMELYRNSFKKVPQDRGEVYAKYCFHWHLKILTELLDKNSPILMAMMYMNPLKDMEKVKRIVHISHEIHKIIKGSDFAINMGLKLDYYSFIGTNYGYNPNVEALEKLIKDVVKNTNANISIND